MTRHNVIVVLMLPPFGADGNLPAGIHVAEWEEIVERFGTNAHRRRLLAGLLRALKNLRAAGCDCAYLDGSFVTAKELPGDFDGCWELTGVDLSRVDRVLKTFANGRAAQKAKYLGELFPASWKADHAGSTYLEFFQLDKASGGTKGIVKIRLQGLPQ